MQTAIPKLVGTSRPTDAAIILTLNFFIFLHSYFHDVIVLSDHLVGFIKREAICRYTIYVDNLVAGSEYSHPA